MSNKKHVISKYGNSTYMLDLFLMPFYGGVGIVSFLG